MRSRIAPIKENLITVSEVELKLKWLDTKKKKHPIMETIIK
ncbi:hypothetical protein [Neobacillus drentensis]